MRPWPGSCGKSVAPSWWPWAPCWERPGSIVPRASRTRVAGLHDGRVKLQVAAPPVDGEANAELVTLLARHFGCARSAVEVITGASARLKRVRIAAPRS